MKKRLFFVLCSLVGWATLSAQLPKAEQDLHRAMDILDATMERSFRGTSTNFYMVDVCDVTNTDVSGPSDVWPYTAAIEAHCSVLEALAALKDDLPLLYDDCYDRYAQQLMVLVDNLDYYRGQRFMPCLVPAHADAATSRAIT